MDIVVLQERQDKTVGGEPTGDHHIHHGRTITILTILFSIISIIVILCLSFFVEQVEDFWALYNHIELASRLAAGCDYSLFKVSHFRHALCQGDEEEKEHHENIIGQTRITRVLKS